MYIASTIHVYIPTFVSIESKHVYMEVNYRVLYIMLKCIHYSSPLNAHLLLA